MRVLTILFALSLCAQEKSRFEILGWIAGNWTGNMGRATIEGDERGQHQKQEFRFLRQHIPGK